jgi:hypothetical protein
VKLFLCDHLVKILEKTGIRVPPLRIFLFFQKRNLKEEIVNCNSGKLEQACKVLKKIK